LVSDGGVGVDLLEFLVSPFGPSKSGGFIHLAFENKANGGSLLDKMPFQGRARVAQRGQVIAKPYPSSGR
jgi:hypothetical protein